MWMMVIAALQLPTVRETFVPPTPQSSRDCPHGPNQDFALSGSITKVPEYHDCQRFIDASGTSYLPGRMAIFVRKGLGAVQWPAAAMPSGVSIPQPCRTVSCNTPGPPQTTQAAVLAATEPIALVWNLDKQNYGPLELTNQNEYYCLFILKGPAAKLVAVSNQADCHPDSAYAASQPGLPLKVKALQSANVPQTGRWAWDAANKQHYIAMACPGGWCEIYTNLQHVSEQSVPGVSTSSSSHNFGPWIDQQPLGVPGSNGRLVPVPSLVATGVPAEGLDQLRIPDFLPGADGLPRWQTVGWLYVTSDNPVYRRKLNLRSDQPARLEICAWRRGTRACLPTSLVLEATGLAGVQNPCQSLGETAEDGTIRYWVARLVQRSGANTDIRYHCVKRTGHPLQPGDIPATLRWHWTANDEGKWAKCDAGCCRIM